MSAAAWEMTHSEETDASAAFAWNFWSDVKNWVDPPAEFALEGPFAVGMRGATRIPEQAPLYWWIREVTAPVGARIEMELLGAVLSFEWRFVGLADGRTRLTQRVSLRGEKAEAYLQHAKAFGANLPAGMKKMAAMMAEAEKASS